MSFLKENPKLNIHSQFGRQGRIELSLSIARDEANKLLGVNDYLWKQSLYRLRKRRGKTQSKLRNRLKKPQHRYHIDASVMEWCGDNVVLR